MRPQIPSAALDGTSLQDELPRSVASTIHPVNHPSIIQAVQSAWMAALPSTPFVTDKSWSDIGVDSLKALEFVLRLERSLGMRVPFDAMTPECTALDLIRLLVDNHAPDSKVESKWQVFLIPGILGDEPKLATFRKALSKEVAFEILELPDIDAPTSILRSVAATAAVLAKRVFEIQPQGDIFLAGFSFGGLVAQDMATQLEARGRRVRFLAVFDGPLGPTGIFATFLSETAYDIVGIRSALRQEQGLADSKPRTLAKLRASFDRPIFAGLIRIGAWALARRLLLKAASRHDSMWLNRRRRRFLYTVRGWAILRWRPAASNASTLLFASEDEMASIEAWQSICPRLRVTRLHVEHGQMFEPETLAIVRQTFLEQLADNGD
jgi:thioesterase domain-containing protein/acyl carrier protein